MLFLLCLTGLEIPSKEFMYMMLETWKGKLLMTERLNLDEPSEFLKTK